MRLISDDTLAVITIWQEAGGEPFEGKVAVGEVIRTRARQRKLSIGATVLQLKQFSEWNENDPRSIRSMLLDDEDLNVQECKKAWLASALTHVANGASHYLNEATVLNVSGKLPAWFNPEKVVARIGHHTFLKL